jgi:hypothetical protein
MIFLIVFLLFGLLVFGTIKMFLSKKIVIKVLAIIPTVGLLTIGYFIFDAFFPDENFYIKEWHRNTDLPFPESANFEWKGATFPDHHNSYTSTAIIVVSQKDYTNLYKLALSNHTIIPDTSSLGYQGMFEQFTPYDYDSNDYKDFFYSSIGYSFKIGFGVDNKTIIYQYKH